MRREDNTAAPVPALATEGARRPSVGLRKPVGSFIAPTAVVERVATGAVPETGDEAGIGDEAGPRSEAPPPPPPPRPCTEVVIPARPADGLVGGTLLLRTLVVPIRRDWLTGPPTLLGPAVWEEGAPTTTTGAEAPVVTPRPVLAAEAAVLGLAGAARPTELLPVDAPVPKLGRRAPAANEELALVEADEDATRGWALALRFTGRWAA